MCVKFQKNLVALSFLKMQLFAQEVPRHHENNERGVEEGKSDLATSRAGAGMKAGVDIWRITRSLSLFYVVITDRKTWSSLLIILDLDSLSLSLSLSLRAVCSAGVGPIFPHSFSPS